LKFIIFIYFRSTKAKKAISYSNYC